ncbi:MAG: hypothetical protein ORN54_03620 [Cyclobacteriaceae bacterium]|nr:hypothetical protein [Cyclobacteriaceae bacterium]
MWKIAEFGELTQDLLAIIHCFSSRLYGVRKYQAKVKKIVDGIDPWDKGDKLKQIGRFEKV